MKELFPRARNVEWNGARPTIVKSDDPYNSGFKGFLTGEDTVMMVKYAEQPHRVSVSLCSMLLSFDVLPYFLTVLTFTPTQFGFSQKYPHRTYESMISTLYKVSHLPGSHSYPVFRRHQPPSTFFFSVSVPLPPCLHFYLSSSIMFLHAVVLFRPAPFSTIFLPYPCTYLVVALITTNPPSLPPKTVPVAQPRNLHPLSTRRPLHRRPFPTVRSRLQHRLERGL